MRLDQTIEFDGVTRTAREWADLLGLEDAALAYRLRHWPIERALTEPASERKQRRYRLSSPSVEDVIARQAAREAREAAELAQRPAPTRREPERTIWYGLHVIDAVVEEPRTCARRECGASFYPAELARITCSPKCRALFIADHLVDEEHGVTISRAPLGRHGQPLSPAAEEKPVALVRSVKPAAVRRARRRRGGGGLACSGVRAALPDVPLAARARRVPGGLLT